ncbi:PREDICTED: uncharacterized protein LOC105150888 isoform X1 [Acromyrmex echinatior]|uniref:uncharacterized protein LOC105150888 isoform X1 n=1 Tax=Acromyrmex echinatior TaxID=103372 RepID=UPI000580BB1A|nr:PREDICTED: uncharacterized protein LOC105150888 isoform X1 [Acromyrmex echinatior]
MEEGCREKRREGETVPSDLNVVDLKVYLPYFDHQQHGVLIYGSLVHHKRTISTAVGDDATGAKLCQAMRCCIGDEVRISKSANERSPQRSIFNRLYGRWAIFLRRPGNGTGPIGEGERIGGFAEHISGRSHEIRFYGR